MLVTGYRVFTLVEVKASAPNSLTRFLRTHKVIAIRDPKKISGTAAVRTIPNATATESSSSCLEVAAPGISVVDVFC